MISQNKNVKGEFRNI